MLNNLLLKLMTEINLYFKQSCAPKRHAINHHETSDPKNFRFFHLIKEILIHKLQKYYAMISTFWSTWQLMTASHWVEKCQVAALEVFRCLADLNCPKSASLKKIFDQNKSRLSSEHKNKSEWWLHGCRIKWTYWGALTWNRKRWLFSIKEN